MTICPDSSALLLRKLVAVKTICSSASSSQLKPCAACASSSQTKSLVVAEELPPGPALCRPTISPLPVGGLQDAGHTVVAKCFFILRRALRRSTGCRELRLYSLHRRLRFFLIRLLRVQRIRCIVHVIFYLHCFYEHQMQD